MDDPRGSQSDDAEQRIRRRLCGEVVGLVRPEFDCREILREILVAYIGSEGCSYFLTSAAETTSVHGVFYVSAWG
jgi:hypothetical protein